MTRFLVVAVCLALCGCGARQVAHGSPPVAPSPIARASILRPGEAASIPNPGTGRADPRVARALLTRFQSAHEQADMPGGVVALPVPDRRSMFIPLRQVSSPLDGGADCDRWTGGMWLAALTSFNVPGVQLGVTKLNAIDLHAVARATPRAGRMQDPLTFSEAVITGPATALGDPRLPVACKRLRGLGDDAGAIEPLAVPRTGSRSWAFRITGTGTIPVWQWVEVVQAPGFLIEIRIPNQKPAPKTDPAGLLPRIAQAAYAKAQSALA